MIPIRDANPARTVPVVNYLLIGLNVLVFIVELMMGRNLGALIDTFGVVPVRIVSALESYSFNPAVYLNKTWEFLEPIDVISGLVKAGVFGFLISLMGCYHGYHSRGGAQGVGAATTNSVVSASILILASNYFITELFFA